MWKYKRVIFLVIIFILILTFSNGPSIKASTQIKAGSLDYQDDWIDLRDGVTIFWQEYEITSESGEIDREESITYLYESIKVLFNRGQINSDELVIFTEKNELVFSDNVVLNYKMENEDEDSENEDNEGEDNEDEQNEELELTTNKLVYNTESETFEMEESLEIKQTNRTIKAGEGTYKESEEMFYLRSGVEIIDDKGDKITSDTASIDLSEGDIFTAEGNVEIEIDM